MKGELPKLPNKLNDSFSPFWSQLAVGFGRAGLYPPLDLICITMFLASFDIGHTVLLSTYTLHTTEHGTGLRSSEGIQFFVLLSTPAIPSCKESVNLNNQTTNVTLTSTRFSKKKAAKLDRDGVLLDLIRPAHRGLLIILEREDRKAESFPSASSMGSACLTRKALL